MDLLTPDLMLTYYVLVLHICYPTLSPIDAVEVDIIIPIIQMRK